MLYSFFLVNPRRLNFMCWRFGTICSVVIGVQRNNLAYSVTDFRFSWYGFRKRVPIFDAAKPACISYNSCLRMSKWGPFVPLLSSLNRYILFNYTEEHCEFQRSYLRLYVVSMPVFAILNPRLFLQYLLRVKLQCLIYCLFRLLRVCDSFIDHEKKLRHKECWSVACFFFCF
jgi:hypothetical protein